METVKKQLSDTAAEVMGRLSAASMESYSRAYPHLVRLHMLQVGPMATWLTANWKHLRSVLAESLLGC
jgi:hypothetical protein